MAFAALSRLVERCYRNPMLKRWLAVLSVLLTAGCFEVDNAIRLERDLSGTADFHFGIDFEPMVVVMAQFAREMDGKKGPATAAEIEKARAEFKTSSKGGDEQPSRAEVEKSLPPGVKLLGFKVDQRDFGLATDLELAFDRVTRLVGVKLPSKESGDPTRKSVIDTPFEGLEVIEKGDLITIRSRPQNPAEAVKKQASDAPPVDAATERIVRDAFAKMRVSYRITAPFTIVSHNATRKEGNTLIWLFDMERFETSKDPEDLAVNVTYRR